MRKLHRDSAKLRSQLQLQAAARRKAESALKLAAKGADADSFARAAHLQIESEERVARLTQELDATKRLYEKVRQRASQYIKRSRKQVEQLQASLTELRRRAA